MRNVKWIFVVLLLCSLTSFVEKDRPTGGLNVGDRAPDFLISSGSNGQQLHLDNLKSKYVLLSFWASYDAQSRMRNVNLNHVLRTSAKDKDVKMVSVSFDEYKSIFDETIRKDGLFISDCFVETAGEASGLFKNYSLNRGFQNYLLNDKGVIIAKNISASDIFSYLN